MGETCSSTNSHNNSREIKSSVSNLVLSCRQVAKENANIACDEDLESTQAQSIPQEIRSSKELTSKIYVKYEKLTLEAKCFEEVKEVDKVPEEFSEIIIPRIPKFQYTRP